MLRGMLSWPGALQAQAGGRHPMVKTVLDRCCCDAHGGKLHQRALSACNSACNPETHLLQS